MNLTQLSGVGEKTEKLFYHAGVGSVSELLYYYPRYYDTYEAPLPVCDLRCNKTQAVLAYPVREPEVRRKKNLVLVRVYLRDTFGNGMSATWFNAPYIKGKLTVGKTFVFRGYVKERYGSFVMEQPQIFTESQYSGKMGAMQPVYPLVAGLTNHMVSKAVKEAFRLVSPKEFVPKAVLTQYHLPDIRQALYDIHYPKTMADLLRARKRLIFDEFFRFLLELGRLKEHSTKIRNHYVLKEPEQVKELIRSLPYHLTSAQQRTWEEIQTDFLSDKTMNRLIQGDVGSGKTIIAVLALITVALQGMQGAFMAPTEVLARQHYENICQLLKQHQISVKPVLLVGSQTAKEKRETYDKINRGEAGILIGTHALIQEKVHFKKLALVVTDEQHRFGVRQREAILMKGNHPHVMVMSATPIPRTLAIIMYGDLDISVINELPENRRPIANCILEAERRPAAYGFIQKQVQEGRQVYVICPTVEYSEAVEGENVTEYTEKLRNIMPKAYRIEFLHGRMKPAQKNQIMSDFAKGNIQILVSTTVVEVGVNVPNATVMMVENAERFGLAQLHQLRGRVGRGEHQSYCIFVNGSRHQDSSERLEVLCKSNDGFLIAGEDLKRRGPGDFFGVRQSGDLEFRLGDVIQNADILKMASEAVRGIQEGTIDVTKQERMIMSDNTINTVNI